MMPRKTKILSARHRANNIDSVPFHRDSALLCLTAEKTPISTKIVEGTYTPSHFNVNINKCNNKVSWDAAQGARSRRIAIPKGKHLPCPRNVFSFLSRPYCLASAELTFSCMQARATQRRTLKSGDARFSARFRRHVFFWRFTVLESAQDFYPLAVGDFKRVVTAFLFVDVASTRFSALTLPRSIKNCSVHNAVAGGTFRNMFPQGTQGCARLCTFCNNRFWVLHLVPFR